MSQENSQNHNLEQEGENLPEVNNQNSEMEEENAYNHNYESQNIQNSNNLEQKLDQGKLGKKSNLQASKQRDQLMEEKEEDLRKQQRVEYAESVNSFSRINTTTKQNLLNILPEPESNRVSRLEQYSHLPNMGQTSYMEIGDQLSSKIDQVVNNFILEKADNIYKCKKGKYHYLDDYEMKEDAFNKLESTDKRRIEFDYDLNAYEKKCHQAYRTYHPIKQAFLKMFDLDREKDLREKKRRQNLKREIFRY